MPIYRKKPVEIEAIQWDGSISCADTIEKWSGGATRCEGYFPEVAGFGDARDMVIGIFVKTLEGEMRADPGDYIIRGVKGEYYPCKPDIFDATYDHVML